MITTPTVVGQREGVNREESDNSEARCPRDGWLSAIQFLLEYPVEIQSKQDGKGQNGKRGHGKNMEEKNKGRGQCFYTHKA